MDPAILKNIQSRMIIGLIRLTSYISLTFGGRLPPDAIVRDVKSVTMAGKVVVVHM